MEGTPEASSIASKTTWGLLLPRPPNSATISASLFGRDYSAISLSSCHEVVPATLINEDSPIASAQRKSQLARSRAESMRSTCIPPATDETSWDVTLRRHGSSPPASMRAAHLR